MKIFKSRAQKIEKTGENIVYKYLVNHGFSILERNFHQKSGEIDIIAKKEDKLHFIEIKSVSCETLPDFEKENTLVKRSEEKLHPWKMKRLGRLIESYFIRNRMGKTPWQFDVLLVFLNIKDRKARVKRLENITV
jgi:putative endonuclease